MRSEADSRWQKKINNLEDTSVEIIQREKRLKKIELSLGDQLTNISGVPEEQKRKDRRKKIFLK